jgi:hypothetical protein
MATQIEILRVLKILGDVYPTYKLSSSAVEIYVRLLADVPGPILEQGALEHISNSSFFPSIAELRQAAFNLSDAINPFPSEYDAWSDVQSQIQYIGHESQPQFENAVTTRVVEQLGWRQLCLSENPIADRAHFIQAYRDLVNAQRYSAHRLPTGIELITTALSGSNPGRIHGGLGTG